MELRTTKLVLALVWAFSVCLGISSCMEQDRLAEELSMAIDEAIQHEPHRLVMQEVFEFPWDVMYAFGPYTSSDTVRTLLPKWEDLESYQLDSREDIYLIVLASNRGIVQRAIELGRSNGDFSTNSLSLGIRRGEAIFSVALDSEGTGRPLLSLLSMGN